MGNVDEMSCVLLYINRRKLVWHNNGDLDEITTDEDCFKIYINSHCIFSFLGVIYSHFFVSFMAFD